MNSSMPRALAGATLALLGAATQAQIAVIALENKVVLDNGATRTVVNPRPDGAARGDGTVSVLKLSGCFPKTAKP